MASGDMQVMDKRCAECLFSAAKVVSDARRDEILEYCNRTHVAFECHKATIADRRVTCRGFYDARASLAVRLARMFGWVQFVSLTAGDSDAATE